MIEETGIVSKTDGNIAKVLVHRRSGCEGCAAQGACEPSDAGMEIEALNPVNAKVGQTVRISMNPKLYLKGSLLVYGIPLTALIGGAIIGKNLGERFMGSSNSDLVAAVAGFSSLILSFIAIKLWSRNAETKAEYKPVIEEIIK
ncbi:MAG: SoxR reducing system RseC family protein [Nitrospirae bacterium]|nr:SoxR reducing system RseC family protein [Nitrospirota bacterium]